MTQKRAPQSDQRESGIVQRMRNSLRQAPVSKAHVLLACSGGKDSVALAALLAELQRLNLLTFSIAHIHHGQHNRADAAVEAVMQIGSILDVDVAIHRLDQAQIETHAGVGLEEALRRERYLALGQIARSTSADCIAIAHHRTDQAETILLHLMRGAGIDGLAGMREWETRQIPWWETNGTTLQTQLWRPLLRESAEEVAAIADSSGLPIVEDPTNSDLSFRRNAVRHQLLPLFEEIASGSTSAIARSAEVVAGDADLLHNLTLSALESVLVGESLSRASLMQQPQAMRARLVRLWVLNQLPMFEPGSNRIDAVLDLIQRNRGGASVQLGSGHSVTLFNGELTLD